MAGAAVAASSTLHAAPTANGPLTALQVVDRIKRKVGIPWKDETVDKIVAGSADIRVRGIATTMMSTFDVLQRAAALAGIW